MEAVELFGGIYLTVGIGMVIAGLVWRDFIVRCIGLVVSYTGVLAFGVIMMHVSRFDSAGNVTTICVLVALLLVCISGTERRPWRKYQPVDEDGSVLEPIFGRQAESPVGKFDKP